MTWIVLLLIAAVIAFPVLREIRRKPMDERARSGAPGHFVELSQGVTYYEWLGPVRGPVAVCVHGLTTPSFVWRGLARGLALMGFRVLVYDHFGRGYSDRPAGLQNRAFFLTQLSDLLQSQDLTEDVTLVGYSMGGAIATAFAATHPDMIRQLVLIAPAGMGVKADATTRFITRTPVLGDWLMLAFFPRHHLAATETERDLPSTVAGVVDLQQNELEYRGFIPAVLSSLRGILAEQLEEDHRALHRAGVPVVAIWGEEDTVIPLSAMGTMSQWSRNARQEVIKGAGHGLAYTHTAEILEVMDDARLIT